MYKRQEDNPEWQVYRQMMQALYRHSPVRQSVAGSVESIRQITAQTLYDCHKAAASPWSLTSPKRCCGVPC